MTFHRNVMGSGNSASAADAIVGGVNSTIVGAGTTHLNATLLPLSTTIWVKTAPNNSGVILPPGNGTTDGLTPGDWMNIYNGDANTLLLYPPLGGSLNGGTVTTGTVSLATKTNVTVVSLDGLNFVVLGPNT